MRVKFGGGGFTQDLDTARGEGNQHPKQGTATLSLTAQGVTPGTRLDYEVWVIDARGAESAHQQRSTLLQ